MSEKRYHYELKALGKRLQDERKKKGWTQLDLEMHCDINRTEISKIENGRKNIELFTIIRLAETLGIETYQLFQYEEAAFRNEKLQ